MKQNYVFRVIFYTSLLAITIMAVLPPEEVVVGTGWDKANHSLAFLVLLGLFDIAYPAANIFRTKIPLLLLYGVFLEVLQAFFPDRFPSFPDILADITGLLVYCCIRPILFRYLPCLYKNHMIEVEQ